MITPVAGRFRMLESVRCYAQARLDFSGAREETVERLVDWLTRLAVPLTGTFATDAAELRRLTVELPNLVAGLEFLRDSTDERRLLLAGALVRCRHSLGIAADGRELLSTALDVPGAPPAYRAYALEQAAWLAAWYDDKPAAVDFAERAVALGPEHGNAALLGRGLNALAFAHQVCGDYGAARSNFAECLRYVRLLDEPISVALCFNNLAWAMILDGDLAGARDLVDEALPIYRTHEEPSRCAAVLHTSGVLDLVHDKLPEAAERFADCLRILADAPSTIRPYALEGLAVTALRVGDVERGLRLAGFAETTRTGHAGDAWWRDLVAVTVANAVDSMPSRRAAALFGEGRVVPLQQGLDYALGAAWPPARTDEDAPLTSREQGITALLVDGLTNRQIASRLGISERTVEAHLDHIRTKLDLRSRAQVAAWAATRAQ